MAKIRTWALVGVLAAFAIAPVAAHAAYPVVQHESLICTPTTVVPGQAITCTGSGFKPGTEVTISMVGGPVLGHVTAVGSGGFSVTFSIPAGTSLGTQHIQATGQGASGPVILVLTATIQVVSGELSELERTGTSIMPLLWAGMGALLLGSTVMFVARRRRNSAA